MDASNLADLLSTPGALPDGLTLDALVETHVSVLAFAGERVFKLKKAVDLGFVDAVPLERRRHFAAEELRLNSRLSPELYVGPVALVAGAEGPRVVRGEGPGEEVAGEVITVGIEMHRLPATSMLDARLERGELDNSVIRRLVERLVAFHASAERGREVDACAALEVVRANALDNLEATRSALGDVDGAGGALCTPALHAHLERWTVEQLETHRELFERRAAEGRAVDGHGDLHAGNVCVEDDRLVIYDCVEFEPRFRRGDAACDLAFLCMDLDLDGYRAFSAHLAKDYANLAKDPELLAVLPFYKVYRALVRAKVDGFVAADPGRSDADRAAAVERARAHFALAASYTLPAPLVLTCGLPATGKSWLGKRLARALGGTLHRSDVRRKQIAGQAIASKPRGGFDEGLYTPENKQKTYDVLLDDARRDLEHPRPAVIDGSFLQAKWRAPFAALATELGAPLVMLHMQADVETVKRRIEERLKDPNEPSEADFDVYLALAKKVEEPDELPPVQHLVVQSGGSTAGATLRVLERVLGQA